MSDRDTTKTPATERPRGMTLEERAEFLGPIVSFPSKAFTGGGSASQELCDVMLALALAFNDVREVNLLLENLMEKMPPQPPRINRFYGEHGGALTFGFRIFLGILHELGEVIRNNSKPLNERFFREKVLASLPDDAGESWGRVEALAKGKKAAKALDQLLERLRNEAAFHYDGAALREGFERRFPKGSGDRDSRPLLSLGKQVFARRFFFADASALDLVAEAAAVGGLLPLGEKLTEASRDISIALAQILHAFIEARGGLKAFAEDPPLEPPAEDSPSMRLLTTPAEDDRARSLSERLRIEGGPDVIERFEKAGLTLLQIQRLDLLFSRGTVEAQLRDLRAAVGPEEPAELLRRTARAIPLIPFIVSGGLAGLQDQIAVELSRSSDGLERLRHDLPRRRGHPREVLGRFCAEWNDLTEGRLRHYDLGVIAFAAVTGEHVQEGSIERECGRSRAERQGRQAGKS